MTSFWSMWVIVLTSATIIGLVWILFANRKTQSRGPDQTTGHAYDGIEEYDNPLPAWWFYMFVITIVWSIAYLIVYPGMGNYPGLLGWTSVGQYEKQVATADEKYRAMRDKYLAMEIPAIAYDPQLRKMGQRMFANNCAQCHGADAKGSYGFPNLTDDDWIFGGDPETIKATITNGRQAAMPPWGTILGDSGVAETSAYVRSLNGYSVDADTVAAGEKHFKTYCVACHGADAKGIQAMGAPNLADGIWLYGSSDAQIQHSIRTGRNGQMPAHSEMLSDAKIHILTAYVYGFRQQ